MMWPCSDLTGQPRPLPSVCLTGMTLPDYVTCFMIMTHVSDLNAHLRGQLMPPVATVTGWGRVGPEEAAPMSRQLLVTQVPSLLTTHHVSHVMSRSLCSVLRSARHSPAPVCLTVTRSVSVVSVMSLVMTCHNPQMCAGLSHAVSTACPGDSGGGLMAR